MSCMYASDSTLPYMQFIVVRLPLVFQTRRSPDGRSTQGRQDVYTGSALLPLYPYFPIELDAGRFSTYCRVAEHTELSSQTGRFSRDARARPGSTSFTITQCAC